jgi:hypothetical protein
LGESDAWRAPGVICTSYCSIDRRQVPADMRSIFKRARILMRSALGRWSHGVSNRHTGQPAPPRQSSSFESHVPLDMRFSGCEVNLGCQAVVWCRSVKAAAGPSGRRAGESIGRRPSVGTHVLAQTFVSRIASVHLDDCRGSCVYDPQPGHVDCEHDDARLGMLSASEVFAATKWTARHKSTPLLTA